MIGTPMPCGAMVCRKEHSDRIARAVADLRSNDTTLMGSRNGHAVLRFGRGCLAMDMAALRMMRCIV